MNYWKSYLEENPLGAEGLLKLADRAYRLGYEFMSDKDYDEIVGDEPIIDDNPSEDGIGIDLNPPMLSQRKTYNASDIDLKGNLTASLKLDGFAVSLVYECGVLSYATTRGDGNVGLTITNHILAGCLNIPLALRGEVASLNRFEVRGEMVIPARFGDEKHNPRSILVGLFGRKDLDGLTEYEPAFFGYDVVDGTRHHSYSLGLLRDLGFDVVPWILVHNVAIQTAINELTRIRSNFEYEADGIVFRLDDPVSFYSKGSTRHHPKGSIAFKFSTDTAITTVQSIEWSKGEKTGKMTPIVHIEPVTLGGCEISKLNGGTIGASLQAGDRIQVTRKGGVIPVILAKM